MKIQIPHSSAYPVTVIEVTGKELLCQIEASEEITEVEENFDVDERYLTITARYLTASRNQVEPTVVLKQGEPEPETDDEETPEEDPVEDRDEDLEEEADEPEDEPVEEPKDYRPYKRS